jgi:hypothetical protein
VIRDTVSCLTCSRSYSLACTSRSRGIRLSFSRIRLLPKLKDTTSALLRGGARICPAEKEGLDLVSPGCVNPPRQRRYMRQPRMSFFASQVLTIPFSCLSPDLHLASCQFMTTANYNTVPSSKSSSPPQPRPLLHHRQASKHLSSPLASHTFKTSLYQIASLLMIRSQPHPLSHRLVRLYRPRHGLQSRIASRSRRHHLLLFSQYRRNPQPMRPVLTTETLLISKTLATAGTTQT